MLAAIFSVHLRNGFFTSNNGIELPFLYGTAAIGLAFTGAAAYSLDAALDLAVFDRPSAVIGLLVLSVICAIIALTLRHHPQTQTTATQS
jgi:hypothetical protein